MAEHNDFGKAAEEFVVHKYKQNNYQILEKNWRFHPLEIDIIALRDQELVIVEVKARSSNDMVAAEDAVNLKKKRFLIRAADEYIMQNNLDVACRFDIAVVLKDQNVFKLKVIKDAFQAYEL